MAEQEIMSRIGSYNNNLTILVKEGLWLSSEDDDDMTNMKLKAEDVVSYIQESLAGARPVLDALCRRDVDTASKMITTFGDAAYIGKLKIMKSSFVGQLMPLWGYPPGPLFRIDHA